jgi:arginine-tRNA-protein transferase
MESIFRFTTPEYSCTYLPEQRARMEYEIVRELSPREYADRMKQGWRRFGFSMFHPVCASCRKCQSLRIPLTTFRPNRSQRRAWKANADVELRIGSPAVTEAKLHLYDRFHEFQTDSKGWPDHGPKDRASYRESFVDHPFPTEEWCYFLDGRLIGCGYVDALPVGLSAIYFFYDPDHRDRSLGTFNVLKVIEEAQRRNLPHVYLGYFVEGCRSLEYKANFEPNEVLAPNGEWLPNVESTTRRSDTR